MVYTADVNKYMEPPTVPKSLQEPYLQARIKRVGFALDKKNIVQQVSDDGHIQPDVPDDLPF
jgi:hypothetical protein